MKMFWQRFWSTSQCVVGLLAIGLWSTEGCQPSLLQQTLAPARRADNQDTQPMVCGSGKNAIPIQLGIEQAEQAQSHGQLELALQSYEHLLHDCPDGPELSTVRLNKANLLLQMGHYPQAESDLQALWQKPPAPLSKLQIGPLLAQAQEHTGHVLDSIETLVQLLDMPNISAAQRQAWTEQISLVLTSSANFADTSTLWNKSLNNPKWAFLQPLIGYKLAKIYYHTRNYERSEQMLNWICKRYADSPYAAQAAQFLEVLRARFDVNPKALGVILPLSGKYRQYGERALQAIELALGTNSGIELIVKDTQGEPNIAAAAIETLVLENHVIGIMGPMVSNEALAAALKAEELGVPLLALSHREGLTDIGTFVFRTALTIEAQAKALAQLAFDQLKFTRFAFLYPRSHYGIDFIQAFWNEIDKRHGEVRGVESYDPEQTTFREPVRRLVGRWYLSARADYRDALDSLRKQKLKPLRFRSELDKLDKSLPPIVDFDALILPDSGRQIGLIAPALAFEDIVLTHDTKMLEKLKKASKNPDLRPVTLMGASTWNSNQTLESCDTYCEDAVFVDAYDASSTDLHVRDFIGLFKTATSGIEPTLGEAQAYDTAGWLKTLLLQTPVPTSRHNLRELLAHSPPYKGVTGNMTFDAKGEVQRELYMLTIKHQAIETFHPEP